MGCDIHGTFEKRTESGWERIPTTFEFNRHYFLFAWLADVRNGFGFAGVKTFTPIIPLSSQRGVPDDFVYDEDEDEDGFWLGDHSFGWLSGKEILEATPPKIARVGIVTLEQYKAWDRQTPPENWSSFIFGPDIVVSQPTAIKRNTSHVEISWVEDGAESLKYFTDEVRRLQDTHVEIRFVFGFDS
jgi:hypothetical protein